MVEFLTVLYSFVKRRPKIYSGNRMKAVLPHADQATRDFLALHEFWLCEYGPNARMVDENGKPLPWSKWWLWQRDADGAGPDFHNAPGILTKNIDLNVYAGTPDQLMAEWSGMAPAAPLSIAQAAPVIITAPVAAPKPAHQDRHHRHMLQRSRRQGTKRLW